MSVFLDDRMKNGNPISADDAKDILAYAATLLRNNWPIEEALRLYLAEAFDRIGDGEASDQALGLKYPRGRPAAPKPVRDEAIAVRVKALIQEGKKKHYGADGAYGIAAKEFNLSPERVEQIWAKQILEWTSVTHGDIITTYEKE